MHMQRNCISRASAKFPVHQTNGKRAEVPKYALPNDQFTVEIDWHFSLSAKFITPCYFRIVLHNLANQHPAI